MTTELSSSDIFTAINV